MEYPNPINLALSLMSRREREREKRERGALTLLSDPAKMDRYIGNVSANVSPVSKVPQLSKYATKTEAYDSVVPEDHPLKGFGPEFRSRLTEILSDSKARQYPVAQVAEYLHQKMMKEPGRQGQSREVEAYEYKRRADTQWFGLAGADKNIRAPADYDRWLSERRGLETAEFTKKPKWEVTPGNVLRDVALSGAAWGIIGGATTGGAGALPGAALGTVAGALQSVVATPVSRAISESEWARARTGPFTGSHTESGAGRLLTGAVAGAAAGLLKGKGGLIGKALWAAAGAGIGAYSQSETGKVTTAELAPHLVGGIAIDKALEKAFLVPRVARNLFLKDPTVAAGVKVVKTNRALDAIADPTIADKVTDRLIGGTHQLGINPDLMEGVKNIFFRTKGAVENRAVMSAKLAEHLRVSPDIRLKVMQDAKRLGLAEEEEAVGFTVRNVQKLDELGLEEAINFSGDGGYAAGVVRALSRQKARILQGEFTAIGAQAKVENSIRSEIMKAAGVNKSAEDTAAAALANNNKLGRHLFERQRALESFPEAFEDAAKALGVDQLPLVDSSAETAAQQMGGSTRVPIQGAAANLVRNMAADARGSRKAMSVLDSYESIVKDLDADETSRTILSKVTEPLETDAVSTPIAETLKVRPKVKAKAAKTGKSKVTKEEIPSAPESEGVTAKQDEKLREGAAKEMRLVEDLRAEGVGTKKQVGSVTYEVVDIDGSPEVVTYQGKAKRTGAITQAQGIVKSRAREAQYISEVRAFNELSPDELQKFGSDMITDYNAGRITAEEVLYRVEQINQSIELTEYGEKTVGALDLLGQMQEVKEFVGKRFADENGIGEFFSPFDRMVAQLRKVVANKSFMATFGIGAGAYAMFMPGQEAEAGMLSRSGKVLSEIGEATIQAMKKAGYVVSHEIPADQFLIKAGDFQRGLRSTKEGGAIKILSDINDWAKNAPKTEKLRHKLMTPGMVFEEVLNLGENMMNSPAVHKVSFQAAEYGNTLLGQQAVRNILRESGIESAQKEVRKAFQPLLEDMNKQIEFEWRTDQVKSLTESISRLTKNKKGQALEVVEASKTSIAKEIEEHQRMLEPLKDSVSSYHKKWEAIAKQAAKDHAAVRVTLALGDSKFEKYPFMREIPLNPNEQVAAGRLREQLLQYKERIKGVNEEVIAGDYVPHIIHPDFNTREMVDKLGGGAKGGQFLRFYRRSFNSRPLFPDIDSTMMRYVSDTEKRIQNIDYWDMQGWKEVMNRTEHIPSIHSAFKMLREGMAPAEQTFGNKFAQRYMEFEAVKRLFLSPSATFKHLIKQTADIAQRGVKETVKAYPSTMRMLGLRLAEMNPTVRDSLAKMGLKATDQDRLLQDMYKSLIPAHGTRRLMLDLGLTPQEELFSKAQRAWGKVQDIGGSGINFAELWDRGLSVTLGRQLAESKPGTTIEQLLYGTYDMVLKNNFLSREFNPGWLKNPKIRALAMFQGTPYKIFERRLVSAIRTGRVVKDLGKKVYNLTKADISAGNWNNTRLMLKDLRDIRSTVKEGEQALSSNLFLSSIAQERDFFGSSVISTFAKDVAIIGAATYGGASVGMSLYHHFFHLPFLQASATQPVLNLNPGIQAIFRGVDAYKKREENDDEFLITKIFQRWLGSGWYAAVPDTVRKIHKISQNDIPKIYQDDKYKYLFAIPGTHD